MLFSFLLIRDKKSCKFINTFVLSFCIQSANAHGVFRSPMLFIK